jgi:hypothetical protein
MLKRFLGEGFLMSSTFIKTVHSIEKVLKGKSGKTVRLKVCYDPEMDVLIKPNGSPLPDVIAIDGTKVDLRKFKDKWKKELQAKAGTRLQRPSSKKKPMAAFLKEDLTTEFETLPEEYDILYEGLTADELIRSNDTCHVSQLSANLKYGSFGKKDLFVLCNFSTVIHLVLRAREADKAVLEKAGRALADALRCKIRESPLKPAGMVEETIDINSREDSYRQVMNILNALNKTFPSVSIHQVLLTKVPRERIEVIAFDPRKQVSVKHHYG